MSPKFPKNISVFVRKCNAKKTQQERGAKCKDYRSLAEGKDRKLLLWINSDPDLRLNPARRRLGHGSSRHRDALAANESKLHLSCDRYLT